MKQKVFFIFFKEISVARNCKVLFVDEAHTLTSRPQKDSGKEAIESIMRYMLLSNGSVQHPVFQICWLE